MYIYTGIFFETERVETQFQKFFLGGTQVGTAFQNLSFPGIGMTNTNSLRPNLG
jgi:hypothetical protein